MSDMIYWWRFDIRNSVQIKILNQVPNGYVMANINEISLIRLCSHFQSLLPDWWIFYFINTFPFFFESSVYRWIVHSVYFPSVFDSFFSHFQVVDNFGGNKYCSNISIVSYTRLCESGSNFILSGIFVQFSNTANHRGCVRRKCCLGWSNSFY